MKLFGIGHPNDAVAHLAGVGDAVDGFHDGVDHLVWREYLDPDFWRKIGQFMAYAQGPAVFALVGPAALDSGDRHARKFRVIGEFFA